MTVLWRNGFEGFSYAGLYQASHQTYMWHQSYFLPLQLPGYKHFGVLFCCLESLLSVLYRVQNKFVKYLLLKHRFPYQDLSYETRLLLCGLDSLEHRRRFAMVILLHRIVNGSLDCVKLTESILIHVPPRHTRQQRLFFEAPHRTNYGLNAFTDRMLRNYNRYFSYIDIFNLSLYSLRRQLKSR